MFCHNGDFVAGVSGKEKGSCEAGYACAVIARLLDFAVNLEWVHGDGELPEDDDICRCHCIVIDLVS